MAKVLHPVEKVVVGDLVCPVVKVDLVQNVFPTESLGIGENVEEPTIKREGYKFLGWYLNDELFDFNTPVTEDITLVAKWEVIQYIIRFNTNTEEEISNRYINHGTYLTEPVLELEGYDFLGWFFKGELYDFSKPVTANATLYARFEMKDEKVLEEIASEEHDTIILNFANCDMVGHTGIMEAAIKAVETVDACVGRVVDALVETGGQMFLCADHGNSDQLIDYETGEPFTAHTTNPVPFILVNYTDGVGLKEGGKLADIAPTLLEMMGIEKPEEMTGESLLVSK